MVQVEEYSKNLESKVKECIFQLEKSNKELRLREKELMAHKESLELALKGGNLGLWDVNFQTDAFTYDERQAKILGYAMGEIEKTHQAWTNIIHPDDREYVLAKEKSYKSGAIRDYEIEFRVLKKDGSVIWVALNGAIVERDEQGVPLRMVGTLMDITQRKKLYDALKEREKRVRIILDSINTGIIIIDPDNRTIFDINPMTAEMIGLTREEIIGKKCHEFICPRKDNDCPIIDHGEKIDKAERELITADRKSIPILKTVVRVNFGGKDYLLENFVDITDSKRAEKEMKQHMADLEDFNRLTITREEKMIELKDEINQLLIKLGKEKKYDIVE